MFNLSLAFKNIMRHRVRTILSVIGIGLAVSAFILLLSVSLSVINLLGGTAVQAMIGTVPALAIITMALIIFFSTRINLLERTKEIGLLRAVGWSRSKVLILLLFEAFWLGFLGVIIGIVGGHLGIYVIPLLRFTPISITFDLDLSTYGTAVVLSLVSGISGGFYPAYKTSGIPPAEALGYE